MTGWKCYNSLPSNICYLTSPIRTALLYLLSTYTETTIHQHWQQQGQPHEEPDEERAGLLEDLSWHAIENFENNSSDLEALVGQCQVQEETRVARKRLMLHMFGALAVGLLVVIVLVLTTRDSGVEEPQNGGAPAAAEGSRDAFAPPDSSSNDNPFFG